MAVHRKHIHCVDDAKSLSNRYTILIIEDARDVVTVQLSEHTKLRVHQWWPLLRAAGKEEAIRLNAPSLVRYQREDPSYMQR